MTPTGSPSSPAGRCRGAANTSEDTKAVERREHASEQVTLGRRRLAHLRNLFDDPRLTADKERVILNLIRQQKATLELRLSGVADEAAASRLDGREFSSVPTASRNLLAR